MLTRFCFLIFTLFFPYISNAATLQQLHEQIDSQNIAQQPYWRLLIYYEPEGKGWKSETESSHFFLDEKGKTDPAVELHALLNALYNEQDVPPDEKIYCRFPARTTWLSQQLHIAPPSLTECPSLTQWKNGLNPHQATLIFAADYLNSPSSMFGHTFLRLDAPEQTEQTRLLAYAINYAAVVSQYNALSFAWKGLTGGYPGAYSVLPYYEKVKEYSDMENRDIWEYELDLNPEELDRLINHLWELRGVTFPYYFLTHNCSYQLLTLLEAARPGLELRKYFPNEAIPTDTLRQVVRNNHMLRKIVYRPSAERRLLENANNHSSATNRMVKRVAKNPDTEIHLSEQEAATVLESAYDLRYYRFVANGMKADDQQDLLALLKRRAAINIPDLRQPPPTPSTDPAHGHETSRFWLGAGRNQNRNYLSLRYRPAYHDLLDPPAGYRRGAHIDFLDSEWRYDLQRDSLRLEYLHLVDINSMAGWDDFFKPVSWFFSAGQQQAYVNKQGFSSIDESHGVAYIRAGAGADIAMKKSVDCFFQAAIEGEAGNALRHNTRIGLGPRAGCQFTTSKWRLRLQSDGRYYNNQAGIALHNTLQGQIDLHPNDGLRFELGHRQFRGQNGYHAELGWNHYY